MSKSSTHIIQLLTMAVFFIVGCGGLPELPDGPSHPVCRLTSKTSLNLNLADDFVNQLHVASFVFTNQDGAPIKVSGSISIVEKNTNLLLATESFEQSEMVSPITEEKLAAYQDGDVLFLVVTINAASYAEIVKEVQLTINRRPGSGCIGPGQLSKDFIAITLN